MAVGDPAALHHPDQSAPTPHDLISGRRKKKNPTKGSMTKATDQHRSSSRGVRRQEIEREIGPGGRRTYMWQREPEGGGDGGTERRGHHAMTNPSCSASPSLLYSQSRTETGSGAHAEQREWWWSNGWLTRVVSLTSGGGYRRWRGERNRCLIETATNGPLRYLFYLRFPKQP